MSKKTILEALTRVKLQARPRAACYSAWRNAGQIFPNVENSDLPYAGSGLQVIARTFELKRSRQECIFSRPAFFPERGITMVLPREDVCNTGTVGGSIMKT